MVERLTTNMQNLELALYFVVIFGTTALLWRITRGARKSTRLVLIMPLSGLAGAFFWFPPDADLQLLKQEVPAVGRPEFASSDACRQCHIEHYESWHRSYHRTMTQLATDKSVRAPFDGRLLESNGSSCKVDRNGEWFFVQMKDPDRSSLDATTDSSQVNLPVVMTTGSHHLQAYWVPSQHGNKVRLFPWVYHIDSDRWIPNGDSFILPPEFSRLPPDSKQYGQVWNNNCIVCHSVAGDVGYESGNWQSRVAELGISCEACHGPGAAHIAQHQNPLTRYLQHLSGTPDPTIVNPARLSPHKSSEVCGQCHVAFDEQAPTQYNKYRAGGDYESAFKLADSHNPDDLRFWRDGTMRVGGREFSGMKESACYLKGGMSCLSCHSMHSSEPNKQMRANMQTDQACLQCHEKLVSDISQHTHHAVDSDGSRCYNCHMPYTSYALFTAIRSHRVDSPSVASSVTTGRPVACNQCHVDQSLGWTADHMEKWYGTPRPELDAEQCEVAASLLWMLRGDAVQRSLAAWSHGWEPARMAAGEGWQTPFLAQLLDDPYSVTRYIAQQSLEKLGVKLNEYDSLISPDERAPMASSLQKGTYPVPSKAGGLKPLLDAQHGLNMEVLQKFLKQRDDRPVTLYE